MTNMSYCRFQNTVSDMKDCLESLDDPIEPENDEDFEEEVEYLSDDEKTAREQFIDMCVDVALDYGEQVGRAVEPSYNDDDDSAE